MVHKMGLNHHEELVKGTHLVLSYMKHHLIVPKEAHMKRWKHSKRCHERL